MKKVSKTIWPGELARPIRVQVSRPKGLAITDPETVAEANEELARRVNDAIRDELLRKLHLLMDHYNIRDKDDWFHLAVALATDHVRGCQVEEWPVVIAAIDWTGESPNLFSGPVTIKRTKAGRPPSWDHARMERLHGAVEQEKRKHNIESDREALSRLARRREWSKPTTHRGTSDQWIETLEARLQEAKRFQRLVREAEAALKANAEAVLKESNSGN